MKSGILVLEQVRTGKPDIIAFRLTDESYTRQKAVRFFSDKLRREEQAGKTYKIEAELEIHYQQRTLAQNRLLRALERIMAMEQDGTESTYQEYHEGLIDKYCPEGNRVNPITKKFQRKRTSELNTVEMAQVIGGAFFELASMGVEVTTGNIANYWIEWYNWRGRQGADPFTEKARSLDQYRRDVPVCEACMKGLLSTDLYGKDVYEGQLAHIVSRGSGGADEIWNIMHLCTDHHLYLQHQNGWSRLVDQFPHLAWRVAKARVLSGAGKTGSRAIDAEMDRVEPLIKAAQSDPEPSSDVLEDKVVENHVEAESEAGKAKKGVTTADFVRIFHGTIIEQGGDQELEIY